MHIFGLVKIEEKSVSKIEKDFTLQRYVKDSRGFENADCIMQQLNKLSQLQQLAITLKLNCGNQKNSFVFQKKLDRTKLHGRRIRLKIIEDGSRAVGSHKHHSSRTPEKKRGRSESRSSSGSRSRSRSSSGSRSRSRSSSGSRSRSRSSSRSRSRSRTRSRTPEDKKKRGRSKERSRSPEKKKSKKR